MFRRVFLLIKRIDFMIQIHESFLSLTGTSIHILVSKRWSPTFFDLADSLNVNLKTHARTNFALFDQFTWQIEVCTIEYLLHLWEKSTLTYSMEHAVNVRQNLRRQFTKEDSHRPFDFYSKTASLLFTVQLISAHDPSA